MQVLRWSFISAASLAAVAQEMAHEGDPVCWEDGIPPEYCCGDDYGDAGMVGCVVVFSHLVVRCSSAKFDEFIEKRLPRHRVYLHSVSFDMEGRYWRVFVFLFLPSGTPSCWVMGFRYTRCCGVKKKKPYTPSARRSIKLSNPCDYIVVGAGSGGATVASRLETAYRVCLVEQNNDPDKYWSEGHPVGPKEKDWQYKFGRGVGGSTLINSGVYTRGNLEDYAEWGGEEYWGVNRTLELFKTLEHPASIPGYEVDYDYHPYRKNPAEKPAHATLVSSKRHELPPIFRAIADAWEENGLGKYRVDPHSSTEMTGLGGVWRWMGCGDDMDAACTPQRVSRWRYVGHERNHESVDVTLTKYHFENLPSTPPSNNFNLLSCATCTYGKFCFRFSRAKGG